MKFDWSRCTGPASSMSGMRSQELGEDGPELQAGQVGTQAKVGAAPAEADVVVGRTG